jgi:hypothetical protein
VKGGQIHGAGILLQMPKEDGNEKPSERHSEEQEASDTWNLPILWNKGLSNWQRLTTGFNQSLKAIFNFLD